MSKQRGLGRGFDSLIPTEVAPDAPVAGRPAATGEVVQELKLESIQPNPHQPRQHFDDDALKGLADSIARHGILQPIVVTDRGDGNYELVAGERRLRASKLAGRLTIPALVRGFEAHQKLELALIENLQRAQLNPLETATAYQRLIDEFQLTLEQVGQRVGKAKSTVSNSLRLLQLPPPVQAALADGRLTETQARTVLSILSDKGRAKELFHHIVDDGWSVRQAEAFVRQQSKPTAAAKERAQVPQAATVLAQQIGDYLHAKVSLQPARKGGRLIINYKDDAELIRITREIKPG